MENTENSTIIVVQMITIRQWNHYKLLLSWYNLRKYGFE